MEPEFYKRFVDLTKQFPIGSTVYHKANAKRAIVIGYNIIAAELSVAIDDGSGNAEYCLEVVLSRNKVKFHGPDKEGEHWKE